MNSLIIYKNEMVRDKSLEQRNVNLSKQKGSFRWRMGIKRGRNNLPLHCDMEC